MKPPPTTTRTAPPFCARCSTTMTPVASPASLFACPTCGNRAAQIVGGSPGARIAR